MKFDIYAEVTNRIINELEKGNIPWQKPWEGGCRARNWATGHTYSLLNQWLLGGSGEWATFKQIIEAGGKVKKGAKSKMVVFFTFIEKEKKEDEEKAEVIPFLKYINVFDVMADVEGLESHIAPIHDFTGCDRAEKIMNSYIEKSGVKFSSRLSDQAYYSPAQDQVVVPLRSQFENSEEFYSTAFHELTHSTGHSSRLDRFNNDVPSFFGSESYSFEELVAEIGAATLMMESGCDTEKSFRNSTSYVQGWLKALANDKHLIIKAAGRAEKAVNLILG